MNEELKQLLLDDKVDSNKSYVTVDVAVDGNKVFYKDNLTLTSSYEYAKKFTTRNKANEWIKNNFGYSSRVKSIEINYYFKQCITI